MSTERYQPDDLPGEVGCVQLAEILEEQRRCCPHCNCHTHPEHEEDNE